MDQPAPRGLLELILGTNINELVAWIIKYSMDYQLMAMFYGLLVSSELDRSEIIVISFG